MICQEGKFIKKHVNNKDLVLRNIESAKQILLVKVELQKMDNQ
jgi:hypothetical protein